MLAKKDSLETPKDETTDDDTLTPAVAAVERWLGNPLTRHI
jgi:hypothetical protein